MQFFSGIVSLLPRDLLLRNKPLQGAKDFKTKAMSATQTAPASKDSLQKQRQRTTRRTRLLQAEALIGSTSSAGLSLLKTHLLKNHCFQEGLQRSGTAGWQSALCLCNLLLWWGGRGDARYSQRGTPTLCIRRIWEGFNKRYMAKSIPWASKGRGDPLEMSPYQAWKCKCFVCLVWNGLLWSHMEEYCLSARTEV